MQNRLEDLLVEKKFIDEDQLKDLLEKYSLHNNGKLDDDKEDLASFFIREGIISEKDLLLTLKENDPTLETIDFDESVTLNKELIDKITFSYCKSHVLIPFYTENKNTIILVMHNPLDEEVIDNIHFKHNVNIITKLSTKQEIASFLNSKYAMISLLEDIENEEDNDMANSFGASSKGNIALFMESIISTAKLHNASDIHVEPFETSAKIRIRVDGALVVEYPNLRKSVYKRLVKSVKIQAKMDPTQEKIPQDGSISMNVDGEKTDLRVSTLPIMCGESLVIRILDNSTKINSFEELGYNNTQINDLNKAIYSPHGMILLTGATGSGKTTSIYAMINKLNTDSKKIITLENPVEKTITGICQMNVDESVGLTFASGLRAVLRQDPDIVVVGEIRDEETAKTAISAAMTGHLVISTLHTNSAIETITRFQEMGVEVSNLGDALLLIVGQRLVRRVCPECSKIEEPTNREVEVLKKYNRYEEGIKVRHAVGCPLCRNKGYSGRVGLYEVIYFDKKLQEMVRTGRSTGEIRDYIENERKIKLLAQDGLDKVLEKRTTIDEVLGAIVDYD